MDVRTAKTWTALSSVICAALLAVAIIVGIWCEFESEVLWKSIATLFVLFFLSVLTHAIMQGMTEKTNSGK